MSDIDFAKLPGKPAKGKPTPSDFGIEYTNPEVNPTPARTVTPPPSIGVVVKPPSFWQKVFKPRKPIVPKPSLPAQPKSTPSLPQTPAIKLTPQPKPTPVSPPPASPVQSAPPVRRPAPPQPAVDNGAIHVRNVQAYGGRETNPDKIINSGPDINLVPHLTNTLLPVSGKVQRLLIVSLFAIITLEVAYAVILGYESYYLVRTQQQQTAITALEADISTYRAFQEKMLATNNQLEAVNNLLGEHHYWTNIFTVLERYTLPNVYYTTISSDTTGTVSVQAITTNFASVTQQVNSLKQADRFVQAVQVATASRSAVTAPDDESDESAGTQVVSFSMSIQLNPEVLRYHADAYFH